MASVNVLKYLKRKKSGGVGYDEPVYIGAEQRFVGALRGTANGNLEEQSILGSDFIATSYWEDTTFIIRQEFRNESQTSGYYVLEIYKYNGEGGGGQFSDNELLLNSDKIYFRDISMVITDNDAQFRGSAPNSDVLIPAESQGGITPLPGEESGYTKTQEEILSYVGKGGITTRISIKALYKKEEGGKTYTKSIISRIG